MHAYLITMEILKNLVTKQGDAELNLKIYGDHGRKCLHFNIF